MYVNSIEERNCMNVQYLNSYHTQVIFKTNCFTLICSQRGKGLSTPTLSRDEDRSFLGPSGATAARHCTLVAPVFGFSHPSGGAIGGTCFETKRPFLSGLMT